MIKFDLLDLSPNNVTVLTLVYNGMPYLPEAVNSVLFQDIPNFNYLIIDDFSNDGSYEYLKSIDDNRITLIRNEVNIGVSQSFNKALEIISTPILIRLDQDDISLPNRVREQVSFLLKNNSIDVICSWEYVVDKNGNTIEQCKTNICNYAEFITPVFLGLCPIWHPSLACRTQALRDIGGFKDLYKRAEDFDVTSRLALSRKNAAICNQFHLKVRRHRNQQSEKYKLIQKEVCKKIVNESISNFLTKEKEISDLTRFYLRDIPLKEFFRKGKIKSLNLINDAFITSLIRKQSLNQVETRTMKNILTNRIGWGLFYYSQYSFLPLVLQVGVFMTLSPQYVAVRLFKALI
tara:strand:- start:5665 stop:6708 length:1044 start_codon:yes stop_codon:yes gene_type:complete